MPNHAFDWLWFVLGPVWLLVLIYCAAGFLRATAWSDNIKNSENV